MNTTLKGLIIAFMITIPAFFVIAIFIMLSDVPENYLSIAVSATTFVSIFSAAFIAAKGTRNNGILSGVLIGIFYMVIVYILTGIIKKDFTIPVSVIRTVLVSLTLGAIGGFVGSYIRRKNNRNTRVEPGRYY